MDHERVRLETHRKNSFSKNPGIPLSICICVYYIPTNNKNWIIRLYLSVAVYMYITNVIKDRENVNIRLVVVGETWGRIARTGLPEERERRSDVIFISTKAYDILKIAREPKAKWFLFHCGGITLTEHFNFYFHCTL